MWQALAALAIAVGMFQFGATSVYLSVLASVLVLLIVSAIGAAGCFYWRWRKLEKSKPSLTQGQI